MAQNPSEVSATVFQVRLERLPTTRQTAVVKSLYDALVESRGFSVIYLDQPSRVFAEFLSGNDSICMIEVRPGTEGDGSDARLLLSIRKEDSDHAWPATRKAAFTDRFGIRPKAGKSLTDWCIANPDRLEELVRWFVGQAAGEERAGEMLAQFDARPANGAPAESRE